MKKIKFFYECDFHYLKKTFRIMRITVFLLLVSILQTFANDTYSQTARLSLDFTNTKLADVMDQIEEQSEFYFLFNEKLIDTERKVSLSVNNNKKIDKILDKLFTGTDVVYTITDRKIILAPSFLSESVQQQKAVTGTVTDESGKPLPGVTVLIKGTTQGTVTNMDGNYSLTNIPDNATLVFSFVGMQTQEVIVGSQTSINVTLAVDAIGLEEVVVAVGYGVAKKSDLTGAISTVKPDDIVMTVATSIDQVLGGRAPGLIAMQRSGQPGAGVSVQIRGNASFASSGVLYVVDGVPVNGGATDPGSGTKYGGIDRSPLSFINPNDIESIEILKDASSASIYGARAGAGVVLISTKKGKKGKARVSYDFSHAFQKPFDFYDIYTEKEYMIERNKYLHEKYLLDNGLGVYGNTNPSSVPPFIPKYSDSDIASARTSGSALDAIQKNGFMQVHNISISGGNENTTYYVSGNYTKQEGVLIHSGLEKFSTRINLDQKLSEKFKLGVNFSITREEFDNPAIGGNLFENAGMILSAFYHPPTLPLQNEDGSYPLNPEYSNAPNPLSFREMTDGSVNRRLLGSSYLDYEVIDGLKLQAKYSYDYSTIKRSSYLPKSFLYGMLASGEADIRENLTEISLAEISAYYVKEVFEGHQLDAVLAYSYQTREGEGFSAGNKKFLTDNFLYNNIGLGEAEKPSVGSYKFKEIWASYIARIRYTINDKYLVTASIRRDGASKFAENKKYGWFPSVSVGWKINNEPFMENVSIIHSLKLRASYGTTGNSNIGGNAFSYYSTGGNYVFGNSENKGVYLSQLANPDLSWETAREINLGLDLSVLNGRVSGTFEYFNKTISDLLSFNPLPIHAVVSRVAANVGKTNSKGWEFSLKTMNVDNRDFKWMTDFNIAHFKDRWVERNPEVLKSLPKYVNPTGEIRAIYGYLNDGLLQVGEDVPSHMPGLKPGMIKVKDVNGYDDDGNLTGAPDGKLNSADRILLASGDPGYTFGLANVIEYKNFDLNIFMYGMLDRVLYNSDKANAYSQMFMFGWNTLSETKDRWSTDNQTSTNPSGLVNPYSGFVGDIYRENGAFLRVKNITLGYKLPNLKISQKSLFSTARLYLDVQNPFLITKYSGIDPEVSGFVSYPPQKSFIIGINITF